MLIFAISGAFHAPFTFSAPTPSNAPPASKMAEGPVVDWPRKEEQERELQEYHNVLAKKDSRIDKLEKIIEELESKNRAVKLQQEEQELQINKLHSEIGEHISSNDSLEKALEEAREKIKSDAFAKKQAIEAIQMLKKANSDGEEEFSKLQGEFDQLQKTLSTAQEEHEVLQAEYDLLKEQFDNTDLAELDEHLTLVHTDYAARQNHYDDIERDNEKKANEIRNLEERIEGLERRLRSPTHRSSNSFSSNKRGSGSFAQSVDLAKELEGTDADIDDEESDPDEPPITANFNPIPRSTALPSEVTFGFSEIQSVSTQPIRPSSPPPPAPFTFSEIKNIATPPIPPPPPPPDVTFELSEVISVSTKPISPKIPNLPPLQIIEPITVIDQAPIIISATSNFAKLTGLQLPLSRSWLLIYCAISIITVLFGMDYWFLASTRDAWMSANELTRSTVHTLRTASANSSSSNVLFNIFCVFLEGLAYWGSAATLGTRGTDGFSYTVGKFIDSLGNIDRGIVG